MKKNYLVLVLVALVIIGLSYILIYKDNNGAICRRWNWKEADRTKLTEQTKNCILVIEALPPVDEQELKQATDELASLVKKYCGGELTTHILNKENSEISLE